MDGGLLIVVVVVALMCAVTVTVMVIVVVGVNVVDQVAISHLEMFQSRLYVARLREQNGMHVV